MNNEKYWNKRFDSIFNQDVDEKALYNEYAKAFKEIETALKKLYNKFKNQGTITRFEVCQSKHYIDILNMLSLHDKRLRIALDNKITETLRKCYDDTYTLTENTMNPKKSSFADNGELFAIQNRNAVETALHSEWSGENYSTRIWKNTSALARDVKDQIVNEIVSGKSYTKVALTIKEKYNQSFYRASTLVRTEASAIQNKAAIDAYRNSGTETVRIHSANDERRCNKCKEASGKEYSIGTEPILPLHPNCRCRYIAVAKHSDDSFDDNPNVIIKVF